MTLIRRTNPFDELFAVRRAMDRLFDEDVFHPRTWRSVTVGAEPALDITTTPDELVVKASLPGWKPEDVDITLTGSTLTIAGEGTEETRHEEESWILNESAGELQPDARAARRAAGRPRDGDPRERDPHAPHPQGGGSQASADQDHGHQRGTARA